MNQNRPFNQILACVLILFLGLGLAFVLPLLANSQSLAAQNEPVTPLSSSASTCFATPDNGTTVFSDTNTSPVQQAVDAVTPGGTVKVAGTCTGVQSRAGLTQTVYISKSLTLQGGYSQDNWLLASDPRKFPTTLDANKSGRVILISGTQDVTLDSLSVTGGLAGDGTLDDSGGGIWSNSEFSLTNSIIFSNTAAIFGGALLNRNVSPIITNVIFSGNSADSGGAIENWGPYGVSSPDLTNVVFSGNSAIRNGGAMYSYGYDGKSNPNLTNVTFSGNSAGENGAAMYNYGLDGTSITQVYNSIFWDNDAISGTDTTASTIFNNGALIILTHSLLEGSGGSGSGWPGGSYMDGGGNIDEDPLFITPVDPSTAPTTVGNLRLAAVSPAVDMGANVYVENVPNDLDGNPRIVDGNKDGTPTVDMGAYEYQLPYIYDVKLPLILN